MQLKIYHGNERRYLFACLVYRPLKAQTHRDFKTKHFCLIHIARAKTARRRKQKSHTATSYGYRFYPEEKFKCIVIFSLVGGLEVFL